MSTLRTNNLQNPDSGDVNLQLTQDGGAVFVGLVTTSSLNVNGNVTIGGTITYEDVTNIDAIGIITARSGIIGNVTGDLTGNIIGSPTLSGISSSISDTAVDIFVYDTSKDSDGGAWRKRTQHTSWYNETLNTATRGSRREFPSVAVLVLEGTQLTIYDGDDPDLPMWMVFDRASSAGWTPNTTNILGVSYSTFTSISMLNGIFAMGADYASDNTNGVLIKVSFVEDTGYFHGVNSVSASYPAGGFGRYGGSIAERDSGKGHSNINDTDKIVNVHVNDVAMTVLPNAPIDSATGLPVPTIAVATDGGVSIIKDDGTVVDKATTAAASYKVGWVGKKLLMTAPLYYGIFVDIDTEESDQYVSNIADSSYYHSDGNGTSWNYPRPIANFDDGNTSIIPIGSNTIGAGTSQGLNIHQLSNSSIVDNNDGIVAYAATSYNTGWMQGDIKGAFLSDTDTTNITSGEILSNGDFTNGTTGWTVQNTNEGSISVSSNQLTLNNSTSADPPVACYQQISLEVGKYYNLTSVHVSGNIAVVNITTGTSDGGGTGGYGNVTYHDVANTTRNATFLATHATMYCYIRVNTNATGNTVMDSVSIRKAEEDRSHNTTFLRDKVSALTINGTITKSAVATGAELVAYSGFSGSNYLQQPYNSDLDFGTGDFCFTAWIYPTNDNSGGIFSRGSNGVYGPYAFNYASQRITFVVSADWNETNDGGSWGTLIQTASGTILHNVWSHVMAVKSGTNAYVYINGVLSGTDTSAVNPKVPTTNFIPTMIGAERTPLTGAIGRPFPGSLALVRASASAPSAEQIKKIYEDEKFLFQENAACTLYGSSDAVTALAYDEVTDRLHVGTSSGRSDFQGLRRINNTTTAVTTAISAHDEFIAEQ